MKGDFTRDTFDPSKHFSRVLMQQGRVQLDADWNEQTAILLHYLRALTTDILGPHAGPKSNLGFEIITKDTQTFRARKDRGGEDRLIKAVGENNDVIIGPGRYYVEGVLVENAHEVLYSEQPGYPFNEETKIENLTGAELFYLDVWERHITYVEDDHIRDVALGGPDTCSRAQVVWQVKVLSGRGELLKCEDVDKLRRLVREGPSLRARARLDKPPTELCVIPPESRYRGAENQLYRVEVHKGGTAGKNGATFKWSRDNGSVTFPIRTLEAGTATLEHLGRDLHLSLKPGDWVEVVDDAIAVGEQAGPLAQVDTVDRDNLAVTLKQPSGVTSLEAYSETAAEAKHALLRRWDHVGDAAIQITEQGDSEQGWIKLEDGVEIWFAEGGQYRAGDYWLIPARTATGDVEWPDELDADGKPNLDSYRNPIPAAVPPHGPRHYYAPLLLVTLGTSGPDVKDCRCRIESLPCVHLYPSGDTGIGSHNI